MWIELLLFLLGVVLVYAGAESTTRGGSDLARNFEVNPMIIGVTIIAFGTSAPELFVSVRAAIGGIEQVDISLGNILGSNITNVGLALGIPLLISTLPIQRERELPDTLLMIAVTLLFFGLALFGTNYEIDWIDGTILLAVFAGFLIWVGKRAMQGPSSAAIAEELAEEAKSEGLLSVPVSVLLLAAGLAGLIWGADMMVNSSVAIARWGGVSKAVIGVTMVAFGTSVPEVAICTVAAVRKETGISLGNIVGSNVFNLLLVGGTAAVLARSPLLMEGKWIYGGTVLLTSFILVVLVLKNDDAGWKTGILLVAIYTVFIGYVAKTAGIL